MKECKNSDILPCSEETVQGIIEALRKLREASELEEASNRLTEHIFEDILKSIKSDDMEKKTKKMTKAEAFEWLSNKKIDASINEREVQLKLFSLGVVWCTLDSNPTLGVYYLLIDKECHMTHCGSDWDYYKTHHYEEISADDILSLEIEEECAKDGDGEYAANKISLLGSQICEILRQMNGHYHVEITENSVNLYPEGTNLYYLE